MKILIALIVMAFFNVTLAQVENGTNNLTNKFVAEATSGSLMEVELGAYASENATSEKVKQLGRLMIKDHSKLVEELNTLAQTNNITVTEKMSDDHMKMVEEMRIMKTEDFDKAYVSMMVDDHKKDIEKFEDALSSNGNGDVEVWIKKTLPILKEHLIMSQNTLDTLQ